MLRRSGWLLTVIAVTNLHGSAGTSSTARENPLLTLLRNQLHDKLNKRSAKNPLAFVGRNKRASMPLELRKMMAASASKLAQAEAHHEKVVKQARQTLGSLVSAQAEVLGEAIGKYDTELERVETSLAQVANSTDAAAAKVQLRGSSSSWGGPDVEARARLGAKVQAAQRESRRLARQRPRAVQEAESDAEALFEDATQPLSRKVGDLSETLDAAKSSLASSQAKATDSADSAGHPAVAAAPSGGKPAANATFDVLEKQLATAKDSTVTSINGAKSQLDAVVKRVRSDLEKGVAGIQKDLQDAQQQEIKDVRTAPAFAPKASKTHKALL